MTTLEVFNIKINDKVIWHDQTGKCLGKGTIVGIKYKGALGTIYKVQIYHKDKTSCGIETKNIHQNFLKKII